MQDLSGTGVVNFTPNFSNPDDAATPNNSSDTLADQGNDTVDTSNLQPGLIELQVL